MKTTAFPSRILAFGLLAVLCTPGLALADPLGTAFIYQGKLADGANPAQGIYDLRFTLYDLAGGGSPLAGPKTNTVAVNNGLFAVTLDFGSSVFNGEARWLEIAVKTNGAAAFTPLTPRQPIMPTPYALYAPAAGTAASAGSANSALTAGSATTAATATTAGTAASFSGFLAGDVTGTQSATVVSGVGGQTAANVASGASAANAATSANTLNAIVKRDAAGGFNAGTVTATSLAGDGGGLTGLNASALASGTLGDARLSSNVALRNAHQTFSGSNTFNGVAIVTNTANQFAGTFSGKGGGLTSLNPTNLSPGMAVIDISGNAATATAAGSATTAATAATAGTAANLSGSLAGDVTGTQSATVVLGVGGQTAANVASGASAANAATSANTLNAIVKRDAAGGFNAGTITATSLAGGGGNLTGLNASALASGTVSDARLSSNVALRNDHQTFSGSNTFNNVVLALNPTNQFAGTFTGEGSGLAGLNPTNLSSGTAAIDISGNATTATTAVTANTATSATTAGTATSAGSATNFTGPLAGDVTGTQAATLVGAIRGKPVSTTSPSANQHLRYNGSQWAPDSVALATDVSGTLGDARLSSNVALRNAHQTFSGSNTFSGVAIVTNTANQFAGTFSGSLSGNAATATTAAIATTATYAVHAQAEAVDNPALQDGSVTAGKIASGQVVKSLNSFQDSVSLLGGSNLTVTPGSQTLTLSTPSDWHLGGNAGTSATTDFLGTTDGQPLAFRVDNVEAARLEQWRATFRVHDFELGHVSRHGTPGRALVDLGNTLALNFGPDWTNTVIGGHVALENNNDGLYEPGLVFGALNSGEGIASKRTSGGNQWGLDFYTGRQNRMSIAANGNVGIGTTNPQGRLQVDGGNLLVRGTDNFAPDIDAEAWLFLGDANNYIKARWGGGLRLGVFQGVDALTVNNGGNVGIGTTSPQAKLDVNGTAHVQALEGDVLTGGQIQGDVLTGGQILVDPSDLNNGSVQSLGLVFGANSGEGIASKRTTGGNQYGLDLYQNSVARLSLVPGGNVGIGTQNPQAKLEVKGGAIKATDGLIIETRTFEPPAPVNGRIWLRTDL